MNILMFEEEFSSESTNCEEIDIAFVGTNIDDRGDEAMVFTTKHAKKRVEIKYDPTDKVVIINNENTIIIDDFLDFFESNFKNKSILLEATTLGFPELLILINTSIRCLKSCFYIVYWEPLRYKNQIGENILHKRDFELSGEIIGFKAIPGFSPLLFDDEDFKTRAVFCLGFENSRLDRAFEDNQMIKPENSSLIFGVPAFKPGWEMNAFANNLRVIEQRKIIGKYTYCSASNPLSVYEQLCKVMNALEDDNESMLIAPIGTKPSSIGVCLFLAKYANEKIGLLFDHPVKGKGRSQKLGKRHLYKVVLNE